MRKSILIISLCALSLSVSSQDTAFKVQSDGNIAIHTNYTALAPISIHGPGNPSYYISCNNTVGRNGISITAVGMGNTNASYGGLFQGAQNNTAVGLRGLAEYGITCVGVMGHSNWGQKSIGVWGSTANSTAGAAIYGTIYGDMGTALTNGDNYAGFFNGNVKITGNIVATTTMQGTLLGESSSEPSTGVRDMSSGFSSVISSLSGLNVTTYRKESPAQPKDMETIYHLDGDTLQFVAPKPDIMDEQFYAKSHYALDADRLEEAFPDLVYVKADGSKAINYMEMIPLLVQSINELSTEIEVLKSQTPEHESIKAARSATSIQNSASSKNILYQNTPNPFNEQTTIRFQLSDNVQNASICIFDMTGKMLKKLPISSSDSSINVNGWELGEGMFLYSLIVNSQVVDTKKMIISK